MLSVVLPRYAWALVTMHLAMLSWYTLGCALRVHLNGCVSGMLKLTIMSYDWDNAWEVCLSNYVWDMLLLMLQCHALSVALCFALDDV